MARAPQGMRGRVQQRGMVKQGTMVMGQGSEQTMTVNDLVNDELAWSTLLFGLPTEFRICEFKVFNSLFLSFLQNTQIFPLSEVGSLSKVSSLGRFTLFYFIRWKCFSRIIYPCLVHKERLSSIVCSVCGRVCEASLCGVGASLNPRWWATSSRGAAWRGFAMCAEQRECRDSVDPLSNNRWTGKKILK